MSFSMPIFSASFFLALAQVVMIDLVLAGDNAIVVGLAASRVPAEQRARVILWGVVGAVATRIVFALITLQLLAIVGLVLAGGILLLWVCWKMYRDLRGQGGHAGAEAADRKPLSVSSAIMSIVIADVSMSLDNVLAVAGAAREHWEVLIGGLILSIALMAVASSLIAKLLASKPWISWIGLAIVLYVALDMIWRGAHQVAAAF